MGKWKGNIKDNSQNFQLVDWEDGDSINVSIQLTTIWKATGYTFQFSEAAVFSVVGQAAETCL